MARSQVIHTGRNGQLKGASADEITAALREFAHQSDRLAVHFHGGLVNAKAALAANGKIEAAFHGAGANGVFFVWESGFFDSVAHNADELVTDGGIQSILLEVAAQELFSSLTRKIGLWIDAKTTGALEGKSDDDDLEFKSDFDIDAELERDEPFASLDISGLTPLTEVQEQAFAADLELDRAFLRALEGIVVAAQPESDGGKALVESGATVPTLLPSDTVLRELRRETEDGGKSIGLALTVKALLILKRVVGRLIAGTGHGVYPTIFEESARELYFDRVGGAVWQAMKGETADTFTVDSTSPRGGAAFVAALAGAVEIRPDLQVTVTGHSTGAVFINNLLHYVKAERSAGRFPEEFRFKNIVFLAPACTCADFASILDSLGSLSERFRMFTMADSNEQKDWVLSVVYPRSLLYLVSGLFERTEGVSEPDKPIVGMERYVARTDTYTSADVQALRGFFASDETRAVWSASDRGDGLRCAALKHGDFDEEPALLASLRHMIAQ